VVDAQLRMYNTYLDPGTDTDEYVDVYRLTKGLTETKATWNTFDGTTAWTTPGGDYDTTWKAGFNGFTNDPEWECHQPGEGLGHHPHQQLRPADAAARRGQPDRARDAALLRGRGPDDATLEVTYLEQTAESTYYAASTPQLTTPNATYTVLVTVSNPTLAAWNTTDCELSYDWKRPDGLEDATDDSFELKTPLPKNIPAGGTVDITAQVKTPPSSTDGNERTDYVLQWDLRRKLDGKRVVGEQPDQAAAAERGGGGVDLRPARPGEVLLLRGEEHRRRWHLMNNLYAGNTVWSYNAISNPSRGLSTFVRMSYNSLDTSDSVAGFGWSLQASSMMRLGTPLDFHPNPNPTKVTLTDGDGTSHWFTWDAATSDWKSPKGVHLYLQKSSPVDCKPNTQQRRAWVLTKPDRSSSTTARASSPAWTTTATRWCSPTRSVSPTTSRPSS
jgi:hypothetical protein